MILARLADPVVETHGHSVLSEYVEEMWLPVLGPTSLLLLRFSARRTATGEFECEDAQLAATMGVGLPVLLRALDRLVRFSAGMHQGEVWLLRSHLDNLPARLMRRLEREGALVASTA